DFEDIGGKQEALILVGSHRATADSVIAEALVAKRLAELQALRRDRVLLGSYKRVTLERYVEHHLAEKSRAGCVTDPWIQEAKKNSNAQSSSSGMVVTSQQLQLQMSKPGQVGCSGVRVDLADHR